MFKKKYRVVIFMTALIVGAGLLSNCKEGDDSDTDLLLGLAIASIPCGDIVVNAENASSTVDAPTSGSASSKLSICSPGVSTSMTIRFSETGVYKITAAGGKLRFVCSGTDGTGSLSITVRDAANNIVVRDTGLTGGFGLVDTGEWVQRRMTAGSTLTLSVPQATTSGTCGFNGSRPGLAIDAASILTIEFPAPAVSPPDNRTLFGSCNNSGSDANLCRDRYVFTGSTSFTFSCSSGETAAAGASCRTARAGTPLGMCRAGTSSSKADYYYYTGFATDPETHCRDTLNGFFSDGF